MVVIHDHVSWSCMVVVVIHDLSVSRPCVVVGVMIHDCGRAGRVMILDTAMTSHDHGRGTRLCVVVV